MEKLKMESVSIAEDSLNKIAELFPNVVTESMGKDGQLHKAIDFDKLKFLLTANQAEMGVVYDDDERYELTWVGKKQAIREVAHPIRKTLRPCPEESRNWEQTQNLYIEGDNLDAMKLLKKSYAGKETLSISIRLTTRVKTLSSMIHSLFHRKSPTRNREDIMKKGNDCFRIRRLTESFTPIGVA